MLIYSLEEMDINYENFNINTTDRYMMPGHALLKVAFRSLYNLRCLRSCDVCTFQYSTRSY